MQATGRQLRVFEFVTGFLVRKGYWPSVREIGAGLGIRTPNGVRCHLVALERKGLLETVGLARAFRVPGSRVALIVEEFLPLTDGPRSAQGPGNGVQEVTGEKSPG